MANILIVDDDADVGITIRAMLAGSSHEVMYEGDPGRVKRILLESAFDIIISDVFMPEFDGIELVLMAREINPEVKIIVITGGSRHFPSGSGALQDITDSVEMFGANLVLAKPFRRRELIDAIETLV